MIIDKSKALRMIVADLTLIAGEKLILYTLLASCNSKMNVNKSTRDLARECKQSRFNVQRTLNNLIEKGYILQHRYADTNKVSNTYHLDLSPATPIISLFEKVGLTSFSHGRCSPIKIGK